MCPGHRPPSHNHLPLGNERFDLEVNIGEGDPEALRDGLLLIATGQVDVNESAVA